MRSGTHAFLGFIATLIFSGAAPAPRWSPDGQWLTWVTTYERETLFPSPGWIFEQKPSQAGPNSHKSATRPTSRIEVAKVATRESWIFEESEGYLAGPEWGPESKSLAFGRLRPSKTDPKLIYEIVVMEAAGESRVLFQRPVREGLRADFKARDVESLGLSWSSDGRSLAFTTPTSPPELVVIRADNGRVLKTVSGGFSPSWSPDGSRLAFLMGAETQSLQLMEAGLGGTRKLAEFGRVYQAPTWSRDGKAIRVAAHEPTKSARSRNPVIALFRIPTDSGTPEILTTISEDSPALGGATREVTITIDGDGDNLFACEDRPKMPAVVVWSRPRTRETVARMNPIDFFVRMDAMSLSPNSETLAFRVGGEAGAVGVWDLDERRLVPLVSDDRSRQARLHVFMTATRKLLQVILPPVQVRNRVIERPTPLPIPGEIPSNHEFAARLRFVAQLARPLLDRPDLSETHDPALEIRLTEAKLYLDYLREDYRAALSSLEALEPLVEGEANRTRWLYVRAQIELALGNLDQAKDVIAYLVPTDGRSRSRIETTPNGTVVTTEQVASKGWAQYLSERLNVLSRPKPESHPPGHPGNLRRNLGMGQPIHREPDIPAP